MNNEMQSSAANSMTIDECKRRVFYCSANYNNARNQIELQLNGAVFIQRKNFIDIGGYDERIRTCGWDNEDLYNRLGEIGLQKQSISYDHVLYVKHVDDGARA